MKIHYDPKCEELAKWFLDDDTRRHKGDVEELAGAIQLAIESWVECREDQWVALNHADDHADDQGEDHSGQE